MIHGQAERRGEALHPRSSPRADRCSEPAALYSIRPPTSRYWELGIMPLWAGTDTLATRPAATAGAHLH